MDFKDVNKLEQTVVAFLNFDDWDLEWCGGGYDHYDAKGKTPKGEIVLLR
jgi:hypothetical protein